MSWYELIVRSMEIFEEEDTDEVSSSGVAKVDGQSVTKGTIGS